MRSFTTAGQPGRCQRCWVRQPFCICPTVPELHLKTRLTVVRHLRESWKSTGTARIAALAIPRLECLEYADDAQPALERLEAMALEGAAVLFPAEPAAEWDATKVKHLVVIDGTWRQTRKMFRRLTPLAGLPRLLLPPKADHVLRLRSSSFEDGRSTLEAIADALGLLEGPAVAEPLHRLHRLYVERVLRARGVWKEEELE